MKHSYLALAILTLSAMYPEPAKAGVGLLSCRAIDEVGQIYPIRLVQSGHASNQYETHFGDIKIAIHQYGSFGTTGDDSEMRPEVSFRIEKANGEIFVSTPGHAEVFRGKGSVEGPRIGIATQRLSLECASK